VTITNETYRWFSLRWNTLVVHIKAEESAQLIFSDIKSENSNHTLEIHLGMERNYRNSIHENGILQWYEIDRNVLKTDEWVSFVVSWNFKVLTVFKKGYQLPFVMHIIKEPFNINFFGIRSEL
jgi:Farnesoic acid 0-methyl transferase